MLKIVCIILSGSVILGNACATRAQRTDSNQMNSSDIVRTVIKTLERSGRSGSLIYRGSCSPSGGIKDSFKVGAVKGDRPAFEALHAAFKGDSTLSLNEDAAGLMRILGGHVQTDLLQLKLQKVTFEGEADPRDAIDKLLASSEVTGYMRANHIKFITLLDGLIPPPSGVHLNATLEHTSLSQALDQILQNFPGVWI